MSPNFRIIKQKPISNGPLRRKNSDLSIVKALLGISRTRMVERITRRVIKEGILLLHRAMEEIKTLTRKVFPYLIYIRLLATCPREVTSIRNMMAMLTPSSRTSSTLMMIQNRI